MNAPLDREVDGSTNGQRSLPKAETPRRRRRRLGPRLAGLVLGALLGLLLPVLMILYFRSGDASVPLTRERLDAARASWQTRGATNYELQISIGGRQSGVVHVVVRDGHATAMTRDGVTPKRRATWDAWTVPSMFGMLETELAGTADPAKAFGAPPGSRVIERVRFDPESGCPLLYERFVLGTALDMSWRIDQFQLLQ